MTAIRTPSPTATATEKRVLSHIDIKPREWPANLYMAACFERGSIGAFEPMFGGPTWSNGRSSLFHDPAGEADLILTSGYGVRTTPHKLVAKRRSGGRLAVWHGEQIYGPWAHDIKFPLSRLKEYKRHVDGHLVWGPAMASLLRTRYEISPEQIFIVGCPKFDILRPPLWHRVGPLDREVLFVSDFALADLTGTEYERVASKHSWPDDMRQKVDIYRDARHQFVNCVAKVAKAVPDERIVVRVHPGEKLDGYKALTAIPNVTLDPAGSTFSQALARAKLVLQFTSTSLFETRVAGVPVYCLDLIGWRGDDVQQSHYPWIIPDQLTGQWQRALTGTLDVDSRRPIDEALATLFSDDAGPSLPRTLAAVGIIGDKVPGPRWHPWDLSRIAGYLVAHKTKELLARTALAASRIGLHTSWASRAAAAERRYEDGPNLIDRKATADEVRRLIENESAYLDWILASCRAHELQVTDHGVVVTCPGWE